MTNEEIELIKKRKLLELQKKIIAKKIRKSEETRRPDFYNIFLDSLSESGRDMFERALKQYSNTAKQLGASLGKLIYSGKIRKSLTADDIYWIFYELGYPIHIETRIVYKKRGETKSISELLREEE